MTATRAPDLPRSPPAEVGLDPARLARIRTVLEREVAEGRIPGAVVAIARRGRLAMLEAIGLRDGEHRAPMPEDALFSIASMTKPMTSVLILQLLEEGRLLLGDPVGAFLPELAELRVQAATADGRHETRSPARAPTIQDLLRHTSGMTYQDRGTTPAHGLYPGSSVRASIKLTKAEYLAAMAKAPLLFDPGTSWEYGFSTDILGLVVETVTGQTLEAAMAERLWQPLGMTDTSFALAPDRADRYARCLARDPLTGAAQSIHHGQPHSTHWHSGGGGGLSTAADYMRFALMLAGGGRLGAAHILSRKTVAFMTADHLAPGQGERIADSMDAAAAGYGFGLGVAVRRQHGLSAMAGTAGDYYWSGVYGTYFWIDPAEELACVFMAAAPGLIRLRYRQLMRALVTQAIDG